MAQFLSLSLNVSEEVSYLLKNIPEFPEKDKF
jgi:hypothetical protein